MKITEEYLRNYATGGIGWTRSQIEALGLEYPAKKGWFRFVIGKDISEIDRKLFENPMKYKAYRKFKKKQKKKKKIEAKRCKSQFSVSDQHMMYDWIKKKADEGWVEAGELIELLGDK